MVRYEGALRAWAGRGVAAALVVSAVGGFGATAARADDPPALALLTLSPSSGPVEGGQVVTATGSGFVDGITTVDVDGHNLPAHVVSATELTFVTPAHAAGSATVDVQVDELASAGRLYWFAPAPSATATASASPTPRTTSPGGAGLEGDIASGDHVPSSASPRGGADDQPPVLAATGTGSVGLALAGVGCLVLGGVVVLTAGDRRRDEDEQADPPTR